MSIHHLGVGPFATETSLVREARGETEESRKGFVHCPTHITHITSAHISLAKTVHMTLLSTRSWEKEVGNTTVSQNTFKKKKIANETTLK